MIGGAVEERPASGVVALVAREDEDEAEADPGCVSLRGIVAESTIPARCHVPNPARPAPGRVLDRPRAIRRKATMGS